MIKDGKYYGIPYRALLPKKVEGLLVAGRMITSEWDAHMSTSAVFTPFRAAAIAANTPLVPPPQMITSYLLKVKGM